VAKVRFCWYTGSASAEFGRGLGEEAGEYGVLLLLLGDAEDCERAESGFRKISGMLGRSRGMRILNPDVCCRRGVGDGLADGLGDFLGGATC
jgi:hypothetical protein